MFIRFTKRTLKTCRDESLEMTLVANHRVGGKVHQRCIKYLGSIRKSKIITRYHRAFFWQNVYRSLDCLELPHKVRKSIEAKIRKYVPIPKEMIIQEKKMTPSKEFREEMRMVPDRLKSR